MDKLIITVNQYPWTSFFVFLGLYLLLDLVFVSVLNIFYCKFKNK